MKKRLLGTVIVSLFLTLTVGLSFGSDYPTKAITMISPMAPGGGHDFVARAYGSVAEKILGQPLVIVNKAGAAGMIGGLATAQATPDGYTLGVTSTNVNAALQREIATGKKPAFTWNDYTPIGIFTNSPTLIVVNAESPWKTLADLIRDAKAKPGFYAFGSGGMYGMSHLPAEIFARSSGLKFRHVPYTGGGPTLAALVGKHIDFATMYPGPSLPLVAGNKIRALAVQSDERLKGYPNVPTVKELGLDAEFSGWVGFVAPKNTPEPIVKRLRDVAKIVAQDKTFIGIIEKSGDEVRFIPGEKMGAYLDFESAKIGKVMVELVKESQAK
jgi:tripartite-type tricarboxylate transporter receptor subunit TctC